MRSTTNSPGSGTPGLLDRLLNRLCTLVLIALPLLMVYGHIRASGAVWNHATGKTFDPVTNYISDYAYRSPAWWAVVACIHGFSFFFSWLSWRAAGRRRSLVSWLVVVAAAVTMFQLHEVAVHPVRSPELTIRRLQAELDKGPVDKAKDRAWRIALEVAGHRPPAGVPVSSYVANHQNDRLHLAGIQPVRYLLPLVIVAALILWMPEPGARRSWAIQHAAIFVIMGVAALSAWWKPEWPGLSQRILYAGAYVWMWVILRAATRPMDACDLESHA